MVYSIFLPEFVKFILFAFVVYLPPLYSKYLVAGVQRPGNLEMPGNLDTRRKRQGIFKKTRKVREFCCVKFIFGQSEHPNFENFLGEHASRPPLTVLDTHENLIVAWKKSLNFILSGDWTPCRCYAVTTSKIRHYSVRLACTHFKGKKQEAVILFTWQRMTVISPKMSQ